MRQDNTRPWRRWVAWAGGVALFVAAVGIAATTAADGADEDPPEARALPADVVEIALVDGFERERIYTGELRARRTADLGFEIGGRVIAVRADVGDAVEGDQVLAEIDTDRLVAQRAELAAQQQRAQAELDEMIAGPRAEVIAQAKAQVREREEQLELATLQLARRKALREGNTGSQERLDVAVADEATARARLDQAQRVLDELVAGTRPERIAAQRARVSQLAAAIEQVDVETRKSRIVAPFAGEIAQRMVDEGTVVEIGAPVFRLVERSRLEAWVGVPPADVPALRARPSGVRVGGLDFELPVARVLPELDATTRTVTVVFELPADSAEPLRTGQVVRLTVRRHESTAGAWLPIEALVEGARGLWSCYVAVPQNDGSHRIERAAIEVLHVQGERALVRGTLEPGDLVLHSGVLRVVPGQAVEPVVRKPGVQR